MWCFSSSLSTLTLKKELNFAECIGRVELNYADTIKKGKCNYAGVIKKTTIERLLSTQSGRSRY
jgi:hypothetical protein